MNMQETHYQKFEQGGVGQRAICPGNIGNLNAIHASQLASYG